MMEKPLWDLLFWQRDILRAMYMKCFTANKLPSKPRVLPSECVWSIRKCLSTKCNTIVPKEGANTCRLPNIALLRKQRAGESIRFVCAQVVLWFLLQVDPSKWW